MMSISQVLEHCSAHKDPLKVSNIYDVILPKHVGAILEIGVQGGGSMRAWCEFYPDADVFGIDSDIKCADVDVSRAKVFLGDVCDKPFLRSCIERMPQLDVIIDDGGHVACQQQDAFNALFPCLKSKGIYIIEDLHVAMDSERQSAGYSDTLTFLKMLPDTYSVSMYSNLASIRRAFSC